MHVPKLNYLHLNLHLFSIILHVVVDIIATLAPLGSPLDEAICENLKAIKAALRDLARRCGYRITISSSQEQKAIYICNNSGNVYELAVYDMLATAEEIRQTEDDEVDKEALSQALETMVATIRARRKHTATSKVVYKR
jgi:hypothetical protein